MNNVGTREPNDEKMTAQPSDRKTVNDGNYLTTVDDRKIFENLRGLRNLRQPSQPSMIEASLQPKSRLRKKN